MAMFGTLVIEDMALNFHITLPELNSAPGVVYTVVDNFDGSAETVKCSQDAWEAALILHALGSEEKFGIDYAALEEAAMPAMPTDPNLRWVP